MSYLDTLLPRALTSEALRQLLARTGEDRLKEGLFFEFKEEIEPEKLFLPKTVAAFANASGGFLLWGGQEGRGPDKGYLVGFPGIPRTKELALKVSNELQQISPLPLWAVDEVESPAASGNVVVVVRVEKSKRPPHILRNGVVYRRTPGGSSDPITDRAMLDRLVDEGREADRVLRDRLAVVNRPFEMRGGGQWRVGIASVPLPVGAWPRTEILTRQGYMLLGHTFRGELLDGQERTKTIGEDFVELGFTLATARVFDDGPVYAWRDSPPSASASISVTQVVQLVRDVLTNQASEGVREVRIVVTLGGVTGKTLVKRTPEGGGAWIHESQKSPPDPWHWELETLTTPGAIDSAAGQLERRLWRSAGREEFEPA